MRRVLALKLLYVKTVCTETVCLHQFHALACAIMQQKQLRSISSTFCLDHIMPFVRAFVSFRSTIQL